MEDWLRWLATIVAGAAIALSGWLLKVASELDKRVTVLEKRPHVDPIAYTEAVTTMTVQMVALTAAMAENTAVRRDQYLELRAGHDKLWVKLQEIEQDIRGLVGQRTPGGMLR